MAQLDDVAPAGLNVAVSEADLDVRATVVFLTLSRLGDEGVKVRRAMLWRTAMFDWGFETLGVATALPNVALTAPRNVV